MFSEYKKEVLRSYEMKRNSGNLSLNLSRPTPAKLKKECLVVLSTRTTSGDFKTLKDFFGHNEDKEHYAGAIKKIDTDRFRPLEGWLKGRVPNPDDKHIELLAWLIDFPKRPFKYQKASSTTKPFGSSSDEQLMEVLSKEDSRNVNGGQSSGGLTQSIVIADLPGKTWRQYISNYKRELVVAIVVFTTAALGIKLNKSATENSGLSFFTAEAQCMYWSGDQYQKIACDQKILNSEAVALDTFRLNQLKKIKLVDRISESDIGKVAYYKTARNRVEFYTTIGTHPKFPGKHLKPMTKYIFDKYIRPVKAKNANTP